MQSAHCDRHLDSSGKISHTPPKKFDFYFKINAKVRLASHASTSPGLSRLLPAAYARAGMG